MLPSAGDATFREATSVAAEVTQSRIGSSAPTDERGKRQHERQNFSHSGSFGGQVHSPRGRGRPTHPPAEGGPRYFSRISLRSASVFAASNASCMAFASLEAFSRAASSAAVRAFSSACSALTRSVSSRLSRAASHANQVPPMHSTNRPTPTALPLLLRTIAIAQLTLAWPICRTPGGSFSKGLPHPTRMEPTHPGSCRAATLNVAARSTSRSSRRLYRRQISGLLMRAQYVRLFAGVRQVIGSHQSSLTLDTCVKVLAVGSDSVSRLLPTCARRRA